MQEIREAIREMNFVPAKQTDVYYLAEKICGEYTKCAISLSAQDIDGEKVFVNGYIMIKEVIVDGSYWECVGQEIGPEGMFPMFSHRAGGWPGNTLGDAVSSIRQNLLSWLDENSQVDALINLLESLYFDGEKIPNLKPKQSIARTFLRELVGRSRESTRNDVVYRPIFGQHLANLHYAVGNIDKAIFYSERWIAGRGKGAVHTKYHELVRRV